MVFCPKQPLDHVNSFVEGNGRDPIWILSLIDRIKKSLVVLSLTLMLFRRRHKPVAKTLRPRLAFGTLLVEFE